MYGSLALSSTLMRICVARDACSVDTGETKSISAGRVAVAVENLLRRRPSRKFARRRRLRRIRRMRFAAVVNVSHPGRACRLLTAGSIDFMSLTRCLTFENSVYFPQSHCRPPQKIQFSYLFLLSFDVGLHLPGYIEAAYMWNPRVSTGRR